MRTAFAEALCDLGESDERVWLLCGDLGYSVLEGFAARFPDRFVNMGVAEQNMVGVAAGLAMCGKVVFVYSIANFSTMRCLEQIRNDVCHHNLSVKIVAIGGGLAYGSAGYTHHGIEDLAVMRAMPNMTVVAPGDPFEAGRATRAVAFSDGPCYLRLGKGGEPPAYDRVPELRLGEAIWLREGEDAIFVSTGAVLFDVLRAADELTSRGLSVGVVSMHTVKPLDLGSVRRAAGRTRLLVTVEEHVAEGGLGESVAGALMSLDIERPHLIRISLPDPLLEKAGTAPTLRERYGLDATSLVKRVWEWVTPRDEHKGNPQRMM